MLADTERFDSQYWAKVDVHYRDVVIVEEPKIVKDQSLLWQEWLAENVIKSGQ